MVNPMTISVPWDSLYREKPPDCPVADFYIVILKLSTETGMVTNHAA